MGYKEYMEARQKMNEGTAPAIQEPTQVAQPVAPASAPKTDPVGTYMEQLQKLRAERAEATNTPEPTRFFGKPNLANQVGGGEDYASDSQDRFGWGETLRSKLKQSTPEALKNYTASALDHSVSMTQMNIDQNLLAYKISEGDSSPETFQKYSELDKKIQEIKPYADKAPYVLQAVGELAPQIVRSGWKGVQGGIKGAVAGWMMGTLAGPASPITAPAAAAAGASALGTQEALEDMRQMEQGAAFKELINGGVPEDVARFAARTYGIGSTGLEAIGFSFLTKIIPGSDKVFKGAFRGALKKVIDQFGKNATARAIGGGVVATTGEAGVETAQQLLQNAIDVAAKEFSDTYRGTNVAPEDVQKALTEGLVETFGKTFTGFGVVAIPGVGYRVMTKAEAQEAKAQGHEWPGLEQTGFKDERAPEDSVETPTKEPVSLPEDEVAKTQEKQEKKKQKDKAPTKPPEKKKEKTEEEKAREKELAAARKKRQEEAKAAAKANMSVAEWKKQQEEQGDNAVDLEKTETPPAKEEEKLGPSENKKKKQEEIDKETAKSLGISYDKYKKMQEKSTKVQEEEARKKGKPTNQQEQERAQSGPMQIKKGKKFGLTPQGRDPQGLFHFTDKDGDTITSPSLLDEDIKKGMNEKARRAYDEKTKTDVAEVMGQDVSPAQTLYDKYEVKTDKGKNVTLKYSELTEPAIELSDGTIITSKDVRTPGISPSKVQNKDSKAYRDAYAALADKAQEQGFNLDKAKRGFMLKDKKGDKVFLSSRRIANTKKGKGEETRSLVDKAEQGRVRMAERAAKPEMKKAVRNEAEFSNRTDEDIAKAYDLDVEDVKKLTKTIRKNQAERKASGKKATPAHELAYRKIVKKPVGSENLNVKNSITRKAASYARQALGKETDYGTLVNAGEAGVWEYLLSLPQEWINDYSAGKNLDKVVETTENGKKLTLKQKVQGASVTAADWAIQREMKVQAAQRAGMTESQLNRAIEEGKYNSPDTYDEGGKVQNPLGMETAEDKKARSVNESTPATDTRIDTTPEETRQPGDIKITKADGTVTYMSPAEYKAEQEAKKKAEADKAATQREGLKKLAEKNEGERPEVTQQRAQEAAIGSEPVQLKEETPKKPKITKKKTPIVTKKKPKKTLHPNTKVALDMLREDASEVAQDPITGEPAKVTRKMLDIDIKNILDGVVRDWMQPDTVAAVKKAFELNDKAPKGYVEKRGPAVTPKPETSKPKPVAKKKPVKESPAKQVEETKEIQDTKSDLTNDSFIESDAPQKEFTGFKNKYKDDKTDPNSLLFNDRGSTPIFNEIGQALYDNAKIYYDKIMSFMNIEHAWRKMGLEKVGKATKNIFSRRESEEIRAIRDAGKFKDLAIETMGKDHTAEDLADAVLAAESPRYMRKLSPEQRRRVEPCAKWLRNYFDTSLEKLHARGINVNFRERMINDLRTAVLEGKYMSGKKDQSEGITDWDRQQKLLRRLSVLAETEYIHIPYAKWRNEMEKKVIRATGQKMFKKKVAKLDKRTAQKRRADSLEEMMNKGVIDKEWINPIEIIIDYGTILGHDFALADIRDAAIEEGLIKYRKSKPKAAKLDQFIDKSGVAWTKIGKNREAMRKYGETGWIRADIDNLINDTLGAVHNTTPWQKVVSHIKMWAFYNPFFLPVYDLVQFGQTGLWAANPAGVIPEFVKAVKDVAFKTEDYFEAQNLGLSSKPFNSPYNTLQAEIKRISNRKATGLSGVAMDMLDSLKSTFVSDTGGPRLSVEPFYNVMWKSAWEMDSMIRQFTYNMLQTQGVSKADAAQLAATFHGDYAKVPAASRKKLNTFLFTPTFKIAMLGAQVSMVKNLAVVSKKMVQGEDITSTEKHMAWGALGTATMLIAYDSFMKGLGFEPDEWGRRYVKVVQTAEGPKELVISWSTPFNLATKFTQRITKVIGDSTSQNRLKDLYRGFQYEITPAIRIVGGLINNQKSNGTQIWSEFDDDYVAVGKVFWYGLSETLQVIKEIPSINAPLIGDTKEESPNTKLGREVMRYRLGKAEWLLNKFGSWYVRQIPQQRMKLKIQGKLNRLKKEIRTEMMSGKKPNWNKIDNLKEQIHTIMMETK